MERPSGIEVNKDVIEHHASPTLHFDDHFISQFSGILTEEQVEILNRYRGLVVDANDETTDAFTNFLRQKMMRNTHTVGIASFTDASTQVVNDEAEATTLINLGLDILISGIEVSVDEIQRNAPTEKVAPRDSVLQKALRFLRPDLW